MVYKAIQVPKYHKVKIKSKEWYDKHKNSDGNVLNSDGIVIMNKEQSEYCGKEFLLNILMFQIISMDQYIIFMECYIVG